MSGKHGRKKPRMLHISVRLSIEAEDECDSIVKSLKVDERDLPHGISTAMRCSDGKLIYEIKADAADATSILSIYNTLDDLIRNLKVAKAAFSIRD